MLASTRHRLAQKCTIRAPTVTSCHKVSSVSIGPGRIGWRTSSASDSPLRRLRYQDVVGFFQNEQTGVGGKWAVEPDPYKMAQLMYEASIAGVQVDLLPWRDVTRQVADVRLKDAVAEVKTFAILDATEITAIRTAAVSGVRAYSIDAGLRL